MTDSHNKRSAGRPSCFEAYVPCPACSRCPVKEDCAKQQKATKTVFGLTRPEPAAKRTTPFGHHLIDEERDRR